MQKVKNFLNEENKNFSFNDFLTLSIIVLIYGVVSFLNLGSTTNPNTFYQIEKNNYLTINLQDTEDIIKIKVFNGYKNANYEVYVSNDNIKYNYVTRVEGEGSFAWDDIKLLTKGKYLKLRFTDDSSIGEVALYNNSKQKIKINKIISNKERVKELTDESSTIPTKISYKNSTYFDEIYFARTAFEYTKGIETYEWTHPPLGKLIQALPIFITKKMTPFNYRLMGNISGILMIIVMYNFGKLLFKKRKYSIFAALLMCLDTFHLAQTRMGTVDSHLVLFIMLSIYYMIKFCNDNKTKNLFFSALFFSLSISVKWTGLYGGLALAIIYFTHLLKDKKLNIKYITLGSIFYILMPLTIYCSIYIAFPNNRINYTNNLSSVIKQQKDMYDYHSTLKSDHYFSSPWYSWPVVYKPIWYHNQRTSTTSRETISAIGNIVIWWMGLISIIYLLIKLIRKKDKTSFFLLTSICTLWLPYIFIGRIMFIYHFFPVLPFVMLSIVLLFKDITERFKIGFIIPIYLILALIFFLIYYSVATGMEVNENYIEGLKLFSSWYF